MRFLVMLKGEVEDVMVHFLFGMAGKVYNVLTYGWLYHVY